MIQKLITEMDQGKTLFKLRMEKAEAGCSNTSKVYNHLYDQS